MTKQEYLSILEQELKRLPKKDREDALSYYEEYFSDAGEGMEDAVIDELGEPRAVARQLITALAIKRMDEPKTAAHSGLSTLWIVLLAIFAAPLGLPVTIATVVLFLCICLVALLFVACLLFLGAILVFVGLMSIGTGIYVLFSHPLDGIAITGFGLFNSGLGILATYFILFLLQLMFRGLGNWLKKLMHKGGTRS